MATLFHSPGLLIILTVANFPILLFALRASFDGWDDVGEAFVFWLGPMWLKITEVMRGEDWGDEQWNALKVMVLVLGFIGVVLSEYAFVSGHFPGVVEWANHVLPLGAGATQSHAGDAG